MGRTSSFLGSGKVIAAGVVNTLTFTGNDLPSAGVVAFHFGTTGANTVANITRLRVKADNRLIVDVNQLHFRKWLERFTQNGFAPPTAFGRFSIPFNLLDIVDDDLADVCQFPRGTVPTVEIVTNNGVAAGSIFAGWTITDQKPVLYPKLIGQQMNLNAGAVNGLFPFSTSGAIRGAVIDTAGLGRVRMELNGETYHELSGPLYVGVATGDLLLESQSLEDGTGVNGGSIITTAAAIRVPMVTAGSGSSRVQLDTGAGWATTNELTLWTVENQNQG